MPRGIPGASRERKRVTDLLTDHAPGTALNDFAFLDERAEDVAGVARGPLARNPRCSQTGEPDLTRCGPRSIGHSCGIEVTCSCLKHFRAPGEIGRRAYSSAAY